MCTVSYLPKGLNSFILTSNRDEKFSRKIAVFPTQISIGKEKVIFPKDPDGGGSWIAATSSGKMVCLLNGAFYKHLAAPYYKKSRGLVLLDVLKYENMDEFVADYDLGNIAPFTLVSYMQEALVEFRWNGSEIFHIKLDPTKPYIWSSVTLYSAEIIEKRNTWFNIWLEKNPLKKLSSIRKFHRTGGDGNKENDLTMNRQDQMYTVSITSIVKDKQQLNMIYEDLVTRDKTKLNLKINEEMEPNNISE